MPIYMIEAKNPNEAIEKFLEAKKSDTMDQHFLTYIVKVVDEPNGWVNGFVRQVTGK
jgi:hypothetical protein